MKTIEIENTKNLGTYEVKNYCDFENIVALCGYFDELIDGEKLICDFCANIDFDINTKIPQDYYNLCNTNNIDLSQLIEDYVEKEYMNKKLPSFIKPYKRRIYVSLDINHKDLYYIENQKPKNVNKYDQLISKGLNDIWSIILNEIDEITQNQIRIEQNEKKKETIINDYKQKYKNSSTKTEQSTIVGQLIVELKTKCKCYLSRDEALYTLIN